MPACSRARSSSLPAGPTKGRPSLSSLSPGCSPMRTARAAAIPSPKTVCVPVLYKGQAVHPAAAAPVDGWREGTPPGFRFAANGSRYLTHMKRLKDPGPGIERYFDLILRLGKKLSVVLWQLPPQMNKADPERLAQFLRKLPRRGF